MNFQSASDIQKHAADEIANSLREADSSYIRISVFLDTKEIESIKKSYNLVMIGILKKDPLLEGVYAMTNTTRVTEEFPGGSKEVLKIVETKRIGRREKSEKKEYNK